MYTMIRNYSTWGGIIIIACSKCSWSSCWRSHRNLVEATICWVCGVNCTEWHGVACCVTYICAITSAMGWVHIARVNIPTVCHLSHKSQTVIGADFGPHESLIHCHCRTAVHPLQTKFTNNARKYIVYHCCISLSLWTWSMQQSTCMIGGVVVCSTTHRFLNA